MRRMEAMGSYEGKALQAGGVPKGPESILTRDAVILELDRNYLSVHLQL